MFCALSQHLRRIGLPLSALALFCMLGGHFAAVQVVAWSTMLWTYSKEEKSLAAGAEKTFSGKAPCPMCQAVKAGREKEQKAPVSVKAEKKAEIFVKQESPWVFSPASRHAPISAEIFQPYSSLVVAPPGPVPRARVS